MANLNRIRGRLTTINIKLTGHKLKVSNMSSDKILLKEDGVANSEVTVFQGNIPEMNMWLDGVELGMTLI